MPFLDTVETSFGERDLYGVLKVEKKATESEIRRAYRKLSLRVHPDRVESGDVEGATEKFQVLGKIYSILRDKDKRAIYDEDGSVDEEDDTIFNQDKDWAEYWRLLFPKVTVEDIRNFEEKYRGSEEEALDLKKFYMDTEGDMDAILENVMCATLEDEPRFREKIQAWVDEEVVPQFPAFVKETKAKKRARAKKYKSEAEEAVKAQEEKGSGGSSLTALIKARQQSREQEMGSFFDSLEEKYAKKAKKTRSAARGEESTSGTGGRSRRKGAKSSKN